MAINPAPSAIAVDSTIDGYEEISGQVAQRLGFAFDPFRHLQAAGDPYLTRYLVANDSGVAATGSFHAAIIAPLGSGKTALRAYATQSSWVGRSGPHPFPVVYTPANIARLPFLQPAECWSELADHTARALLLGLSYRPERWNDLAPDEAARLGGLLRRCLPTALDRCLAILQAELDPRALVVRIEPSYLIATPPSPAAVATFCVAVREAADRKPANLDAREAFYQLIGFVRGPLGFGDVLLLVDGLDGFPHTEGDPAAIVRWLEFLLEQAEGWRNRRMFLKLFLPDSVGEFLDRASPASLKLDVFTLHWTARKLAEMLQQRLRTATNSRIDSMNAFAAPHLPDAEEYVARQVRPYPRDALVFVRRLLYQLMQRGRDEDLQAEDFATALAWYRTQSGLVSPTPTSSIRSNGDGFIAPY